MSLKLGIYRLQFCQIIAIISMRSSIDTPSQVGEPDLQSVTAAKCSQNEPYKCLPSGHCYGLTKYCWDETVFDCFSDSQLKNKTLLVEHCKEYPYGKHNELCRYACFAKLNVTEFIPECIDSWSLDTLHIVLIVFLAVIVTAVVVAVVVAVVMALKYRRHDKKLLKPQSVSPSTLSESGDHGPDRQDSPENLRLSQGNISSDTSTPLLQDQGQEPLSAVIHRKSSENAPPDAVRTIVIHPVSNDGSLSPHGTVELQPLSGVPNLGTPPTTNEEQAQTDRFHQTSLHISPSTQEQGPVVTSMSSHPRSTANNVN